MSQRIRTNFQTLNTLLTELQDNMKSAIPEIYLKLDQKDDRDFGEVDLANFLWNVFEFIPYLEPPLEGGDFIFLILGAFIEDIHIHLSDYPILDRTINSIDDRFRETIECIKTSKISPIISDPEGHYNDTFTFSGRTFKISDFDSFDFKYESQGYNDCLKLIIKRCKSKIFSECFPYEKWKIGFSSEERLLDLSVKNNWGGDGCDDTRKFIEDINEPIVDSQGNIIAHDAFGWINYLSKDNHKFYVLELISAPNVRFGEDKDPVEYKKKYPRGAFINEYCLISVENKKNNLKTFNDEIARWVFFDNCSGAIINPNGFVSRLDFYYDHRLPGYDRVWKHRF